MPDTVIKLSKEQAGNLDKQIEKNAQFAMHKVVTRKFTIGAVGVSGCDFNFVTAANTTAQPKDLGIVIPAFARILDVVVKTDVTFAGTSITAFGVTGGTQTGGVELFASADLITKDAINQVAVGAGFTLIAVTAAAKHIWIGGAPTGGNWAALTAGKMTVYVTYIDNTAE
jgi:hypothetical protein